MPGHGGADGGATADGGGDTSAGGSDGPLGEADGGGIPAVTPPSCIELTTTCAGRDPNCCGSGLVNGGVFQRDNLLAPEYAGTVSDFWLDTYEVTVGRFARFVAGYPANKPTAGSGKNPKNPADPGWDPAWNGFLPSGQAALTAAVQCDEGGDHSWTWGKGDTLPMSCVTWFEAYAFCVWDGGRLPTQLEANYAAAGGSDQRNFPWSNPPASMTIDPSYAVYGTSTSTLTSPVEVGSTSPKGDGKFGQADLAGNVWEWVEDWYVPVYPPGCVDCANLTPGSDRVVRGGSFYDDATYLTSSSIDTYDPTYRINEIGFRCARDR